MFRKNVSIFRFQKLHFTEFSAQFRNLVTQLDFEKKSFGFSSPDLISFMLAIKKKDHNALNPESGFQSFMNRELDFRDFWHFG